MKHSKNQILKLTNMKKLILTLLILSATLVANAQINVFSGNNVGIGAGITSSASTLSINSIGNSSYALSVAPISTNIGGISYSTSTPSSSGTNFGIVSSVSNTSSGNILRSVYAVAYSSSATNNGQAYGVHGIAGNSSNGYNFGVFGQLNGTAYGAAIYGQTGTSQLQPDTLYAGYFVGKVKIVGTLWVNNTQITSSDDRLKQNISSMDSTDGLFNLQPKQYKYKSLSDQYKAMSMSLGTAKKTTDTSANKTISDPDPGISLKTHFGFLAQDLQKVYPNLVYQSTDGTLGIDYQGLIPVIIGQLQKMKQSLDAKDSQIKDLINRIQALENKKP
jgi:Chaperone of endosialidase